MKNLIYTYLFLFLPFSLSAQPGFNRSYQLGVNGGSFLNGTVHNDTLYLTSTIVEQGKPQTVALILCDTNGNLISEHPYHHPGNKQVLLGYNYSIKVLSDQSIAFVASLNDSILLLRYNTQGALLSAMTVPDRGDSYSEVEPDFEEYLSGYIFGGSMVDTFNRGYACLFRTDAVGNVLWTYKYGALPLDANSQNMAVADNNTIIMSGSVTGNIFTPQSFAQSRILAVDSLGQVKWEWRSEIGNHIVSDVVRMDNGDWMFTQGSYYHESPNPIFPDDTVRGYTSLVRVDSNFNERWRTIFTPTLWNYGRSYDLIPTPDNNWIVSSHTAYGPYLGYFRPSSDGGCLTKLSSEGEILWQSCDSIQWSLPACYDCDDIPSGHIVLPSGSSILVGRLVRYSPQPGRSFGWLYKVDANGCAIEPCSVSTAEEEAERVLRVYPNPAHTNLQVLIETPAAGRIRVFNSLGRLEREYPVPAGSTLYTLDCSTWPSGMYFVQVEQAGVVQFTERIFVQH